MAKSRPLLDRLLNTPDLAKIVPHLQPEVLHRVIQTCGLEDCAEFVALATPEQISRVLDLDLWRVRMHGGDEELDADRFGAWLEVLMQSGAAVAAQKLTGLDIELVSAGLARHSAVFDYAAVSSFTTLDGELAPSRELSGDLRCEIGGYVIEGRRTAAWDAIVDLLVFLDSEHPEYFHRLMRGCVRLSNGTREPDGFHNLLHDVEQDMFDLACEREVRREKQGYVTPAQARAFLQAGRTLQLDGDPPPRSPVAQAYFRGIESTPLAERDAPCGPVGKLRESSLDVAPAIDPDAIAEVVDVLREAGVFTAPPRGLLEGADRQTSLLAWIRAYVQSHAASAEALAYLANTLISGCSIQARAFTAQEASDAAAAIGNLGLENWPHHWPRRDLITAFQVGWMVLHRDVCLFTAERLIDVVADIRCTDRDIQLRLNGLRRELTQHVGDRAPWRARHALDVIVMLDAPSWAALLALIDECPVMHAAVGASRRRCRAINAADFEFIARNNQIAAVHEFLESLPSTLTCSRLREASCLPDEVTARG
jgi:Family of unknown function (DUF6178)